MCFQPFNYASNINCCLSKHTSQSQGKKNPSLVKIPSEIPAESSSTSFFNKSSSDRSFSVPLSNGIGIIGGVSIDSSLNFAKRLKNLQLEEEQSSPPFLLCSDPALSKELSSTFFSAKTERDCTSVVENLRRKRAFLEKSGVCCMVMPCHISHSWHEQINEGCSVPFLHVGECVANELKEAKLKPLEAGSPLRIGVLATNAALDPTIYQEKLENEGFEVVLPDKATVEHTVIPAVEALKRRDFQGAQNLFKIALQVLLVRAVNRVILASDYLDQLLPQGDPLWTKCIDPMDALARSSIKYARSADAGK